MRTIGQARELLPPDAARTPAWFEARRTGVTASETAVILGLSRWQSALELFYSKLGESDDDADNDRMELGRVLESYVIRRFTGATGIETTPCGLVVSNVRPWQLATPDAVAGHSPVEAKTAVSEDDWGATGSEEVPLYYRVQLLAQMDVLGAAQGYLCVVFLRSGEPRWYRLDWDGEDIAIIRQAQQEFLARLESGEPPPPDASESATRALRRHFPVDRDVPDAVCDDDLRALYAVAVAQRRTAEENHRMVANQIRVAMGVSPRLVDSSGGIVATRRGPRDALYPGRDLTGTSDD